MYFDPSKFATISRVGAGQQPADAHLVDTRARLDAEMQASLTG